MFFTLSATIFGALGCEPSPIRQGAPLAGNSRLIAIAPNEYCLELPPWDDETRPIPAPIIEVASNNRFVLAKRQPPPLPGRLPGESPDAFAGGDAEYWIVDFQGPDTYGPLNPEQFTNKQRELEVPTKVQLQPVPLYEARWKEYDAARYNTYYWLTFAIPAAVMTLALLVRSWWWWTALLLASMALTTVASGESIFEKWNIRRTLFPEWYFENTGNLAFSYVIAPLEGVAYTAAFAAVGLLWRYRRKILATWIDENARFR